MGAIYKGIILRATDYKEKDKLLNIAVFGEGLITVRAKGIKAANAKLKGFVQILTYGEFTVEATRGGNLLTAVSAEEIFGNCWRDTSKYSAAMIIIEILENIARRQSEIDSEIIYVLKCLKEINYTDNYPLYYAFYFMCRMAFNLGFDYEALQDGQPKLYSMMKAINVVKNEEKLIDFTENDINNAIKMLSYIYANEYGIRLKVVAKVFQTL